jgi:hypothetical protein
MLAGCLQLVATAAIAIAAVAHASGQADDHGPAEPVCPSDQECVLFSGVGEIPMPPELAKAAISFSAANGILDILDVKLREDDPSTDTEDVLLRGFNFVHSISDSVLAEVLPSDDAAATSIVLAALADGGMKDLLDQAAIQLGKSSHLSPQSAAFVAWTGSSINNLHYHDDVGGSTYSVIIPITLDPESSLSVSNGETPMTPLRLKEGVAVLLDNSLVVKTISTTDDNMVVVVALKESTTPFVWPQLTIPINQDLENDKLAVGEIVPVRWAHSGKPVTQGGYRMGLPETMSDSILQHLTDLGITSTLRYLLYEQPLELKWVSELRNFSGQEWYVERPGEYKKFDMLFMIPAHEASHVHFLKALSAAGFDQVLDAVGKHFNWEGAVVTHISLLAISSGDHAESHADFYETGGKAFNMLTPLILVDGSEAELLIDGQDIVRAQLKYQRNEGVLVGDHNYHCTKAIDYRDSGAFRFFAGIYFADVNEFNVETATPDYYLAGYPHHKKDLSLQNAGKHWRRDSPDVKLPTW